MEARRLAYAASQVPPGATLNKDGAIATLPSPNRNPDPTQGWKTDAGLDALETNIGALALDVFGGGGGWSGEMDPPPLPPDLSSPLPNQSYSIPFLEGREQEQSPMAKIAREYDAQQSLLED
jgi:hypothetical protein